MTDSDAPGTMPRHTMLRWLLPVCLALALAGAAVPGLGVTGRAQPA